MAQPDTSAKLAYVDASRGIAILLVILVHTAYRVPGLDGAFMALVEFGQWGVQLFFVVSAFTLCASQHARYEGRVTVGYFYLRRFFRIAPLYYFGILLYFVVFQALAPRPQDLMLGPYTAGNVAANLAFVHGLVPWAQNNIVPGGWSIGVEMAFYLLFPLLHVLLLGHHRRSQWVLPVAFVAAIGINLGVQFALSGWSDMGSAYSDFMYLNLVNNLPVFVLGFWLYQHAQNGGAMGRSRLIEVLCSWFLFLGFALAALALHASAAPWGFTLTPTLAGLAFVGLVNALRLHHWRLRPLAVIGQVSYSMYLLHFLFAALLVPAVLRALPEATDMTPPALMLALAYPAVIALSYACARVTERLIETPGMALGARMAARWAGAYPQAARSVSAR